MEYYERIRALRQANHETQRQLAEFLGTTQQAYMKYEKGVNEMPVRRIIAICRHYNVSADYVLGLSENPEPIKK
ncbi:MAG: helix-turn-helix transcriptional regulator [Clostridia bacterium]|nr:helix-turn-helix transcriptional regulator [Clostridia bacterium]